MTDTNKKPGWYLDAQNAVHKIALIKAIWQGRGGVIESLKEAKDWVDKSYISPTLLPIVEAPVSVVKAVTEAGGALYWHGRMGRGILKDDQKIRSLETVLYIRLVSFSVPTLKTLARFYNVKGRGRMNREKLALAITPHLAYTEAVTPGRAADMIEEAGWVYNREKHAEEWD
jgi:hypothetical protein